MRTGHRCRKPSIFAVRLAGAARLLAATIFVAALLAFATPLAQAQVGEELTTLYSFTNAGGDGTGLIMDSSGNLYGTKEGGGASGGGTVFELVNSSGILGRAVAKAMSHWPLSSPAERPVYFTAK